MKLGDFCDFEGGSQPPKSEFVFETKSGYVRFLQIRDFGSDKNITYIPEAKKNRLCKESDILIGRYGASVGKILTEKAGAYNVALMKTIPNFEVLDRGWFYNYLISDEFQVRLLNIADRSAQAGFSKEDIFNFPVPVPPLPEQQRIVGILDAAFDGIATAKANAEQNLQNARALFESHLQSVFTQRGEGWGKAQLASCCDHIFAGGDVPKDRVSQQPTPRYSVPIFANGEKDDGLYGFTDVARVTKPSVTISARGTIGFTAIRTEPFLPVVRLIVLTPNEQTIGLSFLYYALRGMDFENTGTSIPQLTVPNIKERMIYLPPISQQGSIVAKLDALSEETQRLASLYQRKLAALAELKKSLLHQAFTGQLTIGN